MNRPCSDIGWIYGASPTISEPSESLVAWLHEEPWHVDGWHSYAHLCEAQGNHEHAIDAYSRAIEIAHRYHPIIHFDHAALHYQEALILHALECIDDAHHALNKAIFQDHQHAPAHALITHGWDHVPVFSDYHAPFACYTDKWQQITRRTSPPPYCTPYHTQHDAWVRAYHAGQWQNAQTIRDTLDDSTLCASGWLYRSLMHATYGTWDAALVAIRHALMLHSNHHKHYHYGASLHYLDRARCWAAQKEYPLAYMDAIRASDIDVNHTEAKLFLGSIQKALAL